jgi:hypothetical protein
MVRGDAESIPVLWRASVAVQSGAQQNQGLAVINSAEKISGFV